MSAAFKQKMLIRLYYACCRFPSPVVCFIGGGGWGVGVCVSTEGPVVIDTLRHCYIDISGIDFETCIAIKSLQNVFYFGFIRQ